MKSWWPLEPCSWEKWLGQRLAAAWLSGVLSLRVDKAYLLVVGILALLEDPLAMPVLVSACAVKKC